MEDLEFYDNCFHDKDGYCPYCMYSDCPHYLKNSSMEVNYYKCEFNSLEYKEVFRLSLFGYKLVLFKSNDLLK